MSRDGTYKNLSVRIDDLPSPRVIHGCSFGVTMTELQVVVGIHLLIQYSRLQLL